MNYLHRHKHRILLVAILALALGLRLWGVGFGLPYAGYHPDEDSVADNALTMLKTENLDPRGQNPYALHSYLQFAVGKILIAFRGLYNASLDLRNVPTLAALQEERRLVGGIGIPFVFPEFYLWGRILVATLGTATVWLVYLLSDRAFSPRVALLAALFIAVSPLHAQESHFLTTGVPGTFFLMLSVFLLYIAYAKGKWLAYLPALLASAATIYTKRNGYIVLVLWFFLLGVTVWHEIKEKKYRRILGVAIPVILVFGLAALLRLPAFGAASHSIMTLYSEIFDYKYVFAGTHSGASGENTWWWIISKFLSDGWRYIFFLSIPGLYLLVRKYSQAAWLWLVPGVYFIYLGSFTTRFDRWLLPLIPFLSIQAALAAEEGIKWVQQRYGKVLIARLSIWLAIGLLVAIPLAAVVQTDRLLSQKDMRVLATEWIVEHVPEGSGIVVGVYGPYVPRDKYQVEYLVNIPGHEVETYRKYGADYLVISSARYARFFNEPDRYATQVELYSSLLDSPFPRTVIPGPFLGSQGYNIVIIDIQP